MDTKMKSKFLLTNAMLMLFVTLFLPYSTFAKSTVYKTGYAKFDTYFQTGTFYLPKGKVNYYSKIKGCKKYDEMFRVEIWKKSGGITDSVYFKCGPRTAWNSYTFTIKKAGNHYLKFINVSGGTKHITSYKLYKN